MSLLKKLPLGYHTDYDEGKNKYFWYYLGKQGGGKDYSNKKYFVNHADAIADLFKHWLKK